MQHATAGTVLGDFNDARFRRFGVTTRLFRRDGGFFVHTEGPGGRPADFEIKYTLGVEPLQQYLIELPSGRLQSLTIAWDTRQRRWFSLYPGARIAPDHPLHWTGRYQNWNLMCAGCHTTNPRNGYDPKTDRYATTWSDPNVGCEACHGPASAHAAWAGAARTGRADRPGDTGLVVSFRTDDSRFQVDACAACHSRRTPITAESQAGRPLLDAFRPEILRAGLYHADGQQLDEVYEYGSFRQSKMYEQGVRCTDCHDAHRLGLRAAGNALCTRCHQTQPDRRFPTLVAKQYESPAHHFHKVGSPGARCVNCHMPARTYMIVHPRRDHVLRAPRPDLSVKLGTPNACNLCHTDRSARWAADAVARWSGQRPPGPHWAEAIAAGRAGARDAEPRLVALVADAAQPGIVRATALDLLRPYAASALPTMAAAMTDPDPVVRSAAVMGLDRLPPEQRLVSGAPRLTDPVRSVRIEAARVLAGVPAHLFDPSQRAAFDAALAEYADAQLAMADAPPAHLNLAALYSDLGERDRAVESYRTAIRMDPYLAPARIDLASLYSQTGRNAEAERVLREGIARTPTRGELQYALGLVLAEEGRAREAAAALGRAATLLPGRARVRYNHGLALQHLGRRAEAKTALLKAYALDPADTRIVYAVAFFFVQERSWAPALHYAERLQALAPGDPGPRQLVERIRRELSTTGASPARRAPAAEGPPSAVDRPDRPPPLDMGGGRR